MADGRLEIRDLRGGRNGADPPMSLPENQCVEALNVDWWDGTLAHKRGGAEAIGVTFSSGGPFSSGIGSLLKHVPGNDESAAELWAVDGAGQVARLAASTQWTEPTISEAVSTTPGTFNTFGASLGGFFFLTYKSSAGNRMHLWDSSLSKVRKVGLATPAAPTTATQGGAGLSFTRYYRVRYLDVSGSDVRRKSEPSASDSITITDDTGVTVTKPASISEDETHWLVEYADSSDGPWYVASGNIAVGTTTYSDTDSAVDTSTPSDLEEIYFPPPSAKFILATDARLVLAGNWETSGGYVTPKNTRVWWTPVIGASDIGDLERIPTGYYLDVEAAVTGLGGPVNGSIYVFSYRRIWKLIPTGLAGADAFQRIGLVDGIGCVRQQFVVVAEDENGYPALYFWSHRGPYRIGASGLQYLGNDIEDIIPTVNLAASNNVGHAVYYADKHQVWFWLATDDSDEPDTKLVFDTRLGHGHGDSVIGGWAKHDGDSAAAYCSAMFPSSIGATMGLRLVPHIGLVSGAIWKCDTGTDDAGTAFQAYVETKEYAPAGLGMNCSLRDPHLVAEASSGVVVNVTARADFAQDDTAQGAVSLTPDNSETHVQRKVDGLQQSGIGTVRFRIGDAEAVAGDWTVDALTVTVAEVNAR